nr:cellulase family glycosylhydrolase [Crossiella equi]
MVAPVANAASTSVDAGATNVAEQWQAPLSTRGRYVVDAQGNRFRLRSGNWHGASGTWNGSGDVNDPATHHAGEMSDGVPLGLDRAPVREILDSFRALGLNSIRLPFSNQMLRTTTPVPDRALRANPQWRGRTPLQVYDAVIAELTGAGFAVFLNNHTNTTRWCCGVDGNERWNTSQTVQQWEDDWLSMARRYRANPRVVGADLYNEVRRNVLDDPNWGLGDPRDWHAAAQRAGDRILTEANPDLLIVIEGINWFGLPINGFPHGRPTLEPVRTLSHTLARSNKLVYAAHFYGYTGPNHSGATGLGETSDPRYQDLTPQQLTEVLRRQAFYVTQEGQHFTAPVWISEFGVGGREENAPKPRAWFENFVTELIRNDADFAYWPLVGWHENRRGNGWALTHWNSAGQRMFLDDGDDWRAPAWHRLIAAAGRTGQIPVAPQWDQLSIAHTDQVQSARLRGLPDFDSGARKAVCPDGQRLAGLGNTGDKALCTDAGGVPAPDAHQVVTDERHVTQDWASGYTKFQCPAGQHASGYAVRGVGMSSLLCTPAGRSLGTGRTLWFDRGDNRASTSGGEFAHERHKGQCADDERVTGVAWTGRVGSDKRPAALLCAK